MSVSNEIEFHMLNQIQIYSFRKQKEKVIVQLIKILPISENGKWMKVETPYRIGECSIHLQAHNRSHRVFNSLIILNFGAITSPRYEAEEHTKYRFCANRSNTVIQTYKFYHPTSYIRKTVKYMV